MGDMEASRVAVVRRDRSLTHDTAVQLPRDEPRQWLPAEGSEARAHARHADLGTHRNGVHACGVISSVIFCLDEMEHTTAGGTVTLEWALPTATAD